MQVLGMQENTMYSSLPLLNPDVDIGHVDFLEEVHKLAKRPYIIAGLHFDQVSAFLLVHFSVPHELMGHGTPHRSSLGSVVGTSGL